MRPQKCISIHNIQNFHEKWVLYYKFGTLGNHLKLFC